MTLCLMLHSSQSARSEEWRKQAEEPNAIVISRQACAIVDSVVQTRQRAPHKFVPSVRSIAFAFWIGTPAAQQFARNKDYTALCVSSDILHDVRELQAKRKTR